MSFFHTSCGQNQTNVPKDNIKTETKDHRDGRKYYQSVQEGSKVILLNQF